MKKYGLNHLICGIILQTDILTAIFLLIFEIKNSPKEPLSRAFSIADTPRDSSEGVNV